MRPHPALAAIARAMLLALAVPYLTHSPSTKEGAGGAGGLSRPPTLRIPTC
jgi:hypothetical protein